MVGAGAAVLFDDELEEIVHSSTGSDTSNKPSAAGSAALDSDSDNMSLRRRTDGTLTGR